MICSESNPTCLSHQFFGKANDPDTAKYYERFFELVKQSTTSVNKSYSLDFDTRVTKGEREVSKIRANRFFKLQPGEFVIYSDGKEKVVNFKINHVSKQSFKKGNDISIEEYYQQIFQDVYSIFK